MVKYGTTIVQGGICMVVMVYTTVQSGITIVQGSTTMVVGVYTMVQSGTTTVKHYRAVVLPPITMVAGFYTMVQTSGTTTVKQNAAEQWYYGTIPPIMVLYLQPRHSPTLIHIYIRRAHYHSGMHTSLPLNDHAL